MCLVFNAAVLEIFESKREFSDIESRDIHLTIYRSLPKMDLRIESFMLKLADVESSVLGKRRFLHKFSLTSLRPIYLRRCYTKQPVSKLVSQS
jgi:hypothetical protein